MYIDFEYKDKPVHIDDIKSFEMLLPNPLPREYVDYILKYGTGELPKEYLCFDIMEYGKLDCTAVEEGMLNTISSIEYLFMHFKYMNSSDRDRNWLPQDMIVISGNPGGDSILICVAGDAYGKVFYWKDSLFIENDSGEDFYGNIGFVANDFRGFIRGSRECSKELYSIAGRSSYPIEETNSSSRTKEPHKNP